MLAMANHLGIINPFRGLTLFWSKFFSFFQHSKNYSDQFIHGSIHCLPVTSILTPLLFQLFSKKELPGNNSVSHLITNIPEIGTSFFRNTFIAFPFTRLFNYKIKPSIFDNLFSRFKLFNIPYFGNKSISKVFGNSLYRGENISFVGRPFLNFFVKKTREFFNLAFKEKEFFNKDRRDFFNICFSDVFCRGEMKEDREYGLRI